MSPRSLVWIVFQICSLWFPSRVTYLFKLRLFYLTSDFNSTQTFTFKLSLSRQSESQLSYIENFGYVTTALAFIYWGKNKLCYWFIGCGPTSWCSAYAGSSELHWQSRCSRIASSKADSPVTPYISIPIKGKLVRLGPGMSNRMSKQLCQLCPPVEFFK